jgi:hypothetical protein
MVSVLKTEVFSLPFSLLCLFKALDFALCQPVAGDEEKNLLIGLDRQLNPLEILYNEVDGNTVDVFHAMRC